MNPSRSPRIVVAVALLVLGSAAAPITIRPAQHDFGKEVVGNTPPHQFFQVSVPRAATPQDTVRFYLSGNNPIDFVLEDLSGVASQPMATPPCVTGEPWPANPTCHVWVIFEPKSVGIKTATLVVTDNRGNQGSASFRGEGTGVLCRMTVVPCNYAHLYSGSFIWSGALTGQYGRTTINVTVTVVKGNAVCNGAQQVSGPGGSSTGAITGNALFAIEFLKDAQDSLVYNITAACPSPDHPPDMGGPSRPAELGDNEQQSYEMRVSAVGVDLIGFNNYPDPATDPLNGVSGIVRVRWDLKRW